MTTSAIIFMYFPKLGAKTFFLTEHNKKINAICNGFLLKKSWRLKNKFANKSLGLLGLSQYETVKRKVAGSQVKDELL